MRTATVDLAAITHNMRTLIAAAGTPHAMAVVKADGYGHGAVPVARAALRGGADWLGTATIDEGLELRRAGIDAPVLAWLHETDAPFDDAVTAGVDVGVSSLTQLERVARAADAAGQEAAVHVKVDTGLSRNGAAPEKWPALFAAARRLVEAGTIRVRGLFSHLANTSGESDQRAVDAFERCSHVMLDMGVVPEIRHLASTAAGLWRPTARFDMVRWGIGIYGLSPATGTTSADLGLRPAMTLHATLAHVRQVPTGAGISYDHVHVTDRETTLALVPLGYADGISRQASPGAEVTVGGVRHPVRGRIAMDQFVIETGDHAVDVGDPVVIFGDPTTGVPSVDDWARAADTINYQVVASIGRRVTRRHHHGEPPSAMRST